MAFRRDVGYLDQCEPQYVDISGEEFNRVTRLIDSVLPVLVQARGSVQWDTPAADLYDARMGEAEALARALRAAFVIAGPALDMYGQRLVAAKKLVDIGDGAAEMLHNLMKPFTWYQTPAFRRSEPLAQWEDLRTHTGVLDRLAESALQDDIDSIRFRAEDWYHQAAYAYDDARKIERDAAADCVAELRLAFATLPDFLANSQAAELIIETTPGLRAEMQEAENLDDHVRLSGQGRVPAFGVDSADLSDTHQYIVNLSDNVTIKGPSWDTADFLSWQLGNSEDETALKLRWIHDYGPVLEAAAAEYGIPADVLAGVAYMEVGGKPMWLDDAADWARQHGVYSGDPDSTSYGPLADQIGTTAKALGYDPDALTEKQREQIITSLEDPKQNIMIAAKVLSDIKQSTDFAYVDPAWMTAEQGQRLAAGYNGGPDWDGSHAQDYAESYAENLNAAKEALNS